MFRKKSFAVATIAVLGILAGLSPAQAKITLYECKFKQEESRGGGWIPEMLILTEDDKTGEITVYDPVIKHFVGEPIPAKLEARTNARSTYIWRFRADNRGQSSKMSYTFSYRSNGQPATIRAQPGGYDNVWTGDGTCKVSKG
ncbi:hypothetical protein [Tabrizicola sp.]|uniref:hypothetical protein n=1 Tax=Tabrizicola sp. TaxID=2005166 RepID=UPI002FDEE47F